MIIVTDLDDVLFDFEPHLIGEFNARHNTNFQPGDFTPFPYLWKERFNSKMVEKMWEIIKPLNYNLSLSPIPGAVEGIEELRKSGTTNYGLTHRPPEYQGTTTESVRRHFGNNISQTYCIGSLTEKPESKAKFCKRIGANLFIDDSALNVTEVSGIGIPSLLFTQPWNEEHEVTGLITRVNGWYGDKGVIETVKRLRL